MVLYRILQSVDFTFQAEVSPVSLIVVGMLDAILLVLAQEVPMPILRHGGRVHHERPVLLPGSLQRLLSLVGNRQDADTSFAFILGTQGDYDFAPPSKKVTEMLRHALAIGPPLAAQLEHGEVLRACHDVPLSV